MPTTMLLRQAAGLLQRPHHRVERIGDADDEGVRRVFLDAGADLLHHLEIDAEQIVAAHAGLARHAGGDDADVGALDRLVGIGAGELGVEAVDRRGLGDVERLALRDAFGDVEHARRRRVPSGRRDGRACRRSGRRRSRQSCYAPLGGKLSTRRPLIAGRISGPARTSKAAMKSSCRMLVYNIPAEGRAGVQRHVDADPDVSGLDDVVGRTARRRRGAVRQAEIGLRAHLDQPRRGAAEFDRLVALPGRVELVAARPRAEATSFTAWS